MFDLKLEKKSSNSGCDAKYIRRLVEVKIRKGAGSVAISPSSCKIIKEGKLTLLVIKLNNKTFKIDEIYNGVPPKKLVNFIKNGIKHISFNKLMKDFEPTNGLRDKKTKTKESINKLIGSL